ncbi:MAG: hypothetical protein QM783_07900 [Phycisphaerales bacterium]
MNEHEHNELTPEIAALDAHLDALGGAERAAAPAELEARIMSATSGLLKAKPVAAPTPRTGVLARIGGRRLDWPMRVAAVISVMIGGWAVFHGIGGVKTETPKKQVVDGTQEAEKLLSIWSSLEGGGTAEKIQNLLIDAEKLQSLVRQDDPETDLSDPESL